MAITPWLINKFAGESPSFTFPRYDHAFIPGTKTTLEIFARHSAADHVSDKSLHLKHHQKDVIVKSIHDQPNITAKELLSNYVDTPDSIDFTRRKAVARIISRERTAVLTTKLEGVVVSDSISSLRELCDRLWFKDALDQHNSGEGCLDIFKAYVIGRQFMESDNAESESSAAYIEAYKAASAASRKFIGVRRCEAATCATCNAIGTLLANRDVKDVLASEAYLEGRKFPVLQAMGDNSEAFQKFVRDHLGMDANICQTHATAIGKNNGTQARHFKNREVHDQFYELVLRIKECTFEEQGFRMLAGVSSSVHGRVYQAHEDSLVNARGSSSRPRSPWTLPVKACCDVQGLGHSTRM